MTREEAIKAIDHVMYSSPHEATEQIVKKKYYAELLIEYIEHTVEVVRCKECVHSVMTTNGEVKYCKKHDPLCRDKLYYDTDFFCADGDRKGVME